MDEKLIEILAENYRVLKNDIEVIATWIKDAATFVRFYFCDTLYTARISGDSVVIID